MPHYIHSSPPERRTGSSLPAELAAAHPGPYGQARSPPSPPPVNGQRLSLDADPRADALQHVIVRDSPPHQQLEASPQDGSSSRGTVPAFLQPLAALLERCTDLNAAACPESTHSPVQRRSPFHGRRLPPIGIAAYLERIARHAKCSPVCFVMAVAYMERLASEDTGLVPVPLNVHRLLLTGVLLAAKLMDDRYYNNAYYAKIGGLGLEELNALELHMMAVLHWRLRVGALSVTHTLARIDACGCSDASLAKLVARCGRLLSPAALARALAAVPAAAGGSEQRGQEDQQQRHRQRSATPLQREQQPRRRSIETRAAASVMLFAADGIAAY